MLPPRCLTSSVSSRSVQRPPTPKPPTSPPQTTDPSASRVNSASNSRSGNQPSSLGCTSTFQRVLTISASSNSCPSGSSGSAGGVADELLQVDSAAKAGPSSSSAYHALPRTAFSSSPIALEVITALRAGPVAREKHNPAARGGSIMTAATPSHSISSTSVDTARHGMTSSARRLSSAASLHK
jgi:hypothetical protein